MFNALESIMMEEIIHSDLIIHDLNRDFKELEIYPLSDLHIGDPLTDQGAFFRFAKYILAKPNRFLVYNGDNMNNAIKSSKSDSYKECMSPYAQKEWLMKNLYPLKDRFLAFVEGNHEGRTNKESDQRLVKDIARHLGKEDLYRENVAIIKLTFGTKYNQKRVAYSFYITHGEGMSAASALNRLELACKIIDVDIYVGGHTHQREARKKGVLRLDMQNNTIRQVDKLYAFSGAWQSYGGYAMKGGYSIGSRGSTPILLDGTQKKFLAVI